MHRTLPMLVIGTVAAIPAGHAIAATAKPKATPTKTPTASHTYKGPSVDMRWGPVQAIITVKGKKITKVTIVTSPENSRSLFIDEQAVPMLRDETMHAQSSNIDLISGATMTSEAYVESLQQVLVRAHLSK